MNNKQQKPKKSICNNCNSCAYCMNREQGVLACINFNKFPKKDKTLTTNQGSIMQTNESTIVQFDGLTREQVLCALYNFSHPQGMGFLHFDPKPLTIDEAKEVLSKSEHVDYLKGRVIKVHLYKDEKEFDARLYDRDLGAGAARAAIERYKRLGFF